MGDIGAGNEPCGQQESTSVFHLARLRVVLFGLVSCGNKPYKKSNFGDVLPKKGPNVLLVLAFGPLLFLSSRGVEVHRN